MRVTGLLAVLVSMVSMVAVSTGMAQTYWPRAQARQGGYPTFSAVACLPDGGVLAGTFWDGVFYSPDTGETWMDASAGLPADTALDFAVSPDGEVFVSTPAGVFVGSSLPSR